VRASRIHCQVLEVPVEEEWLPRRSGAVRDLLPWADPYIARLVRRLEDQYPVATADYDPSDPFAADDALFEMDAWDPPSAEWESDAFLPPAESGRQANRMSSYPAVYGGFPLLDDGFAVEG
jgi:hypothetical protein